MAKCLGQGGSVTVRGLVVVYKRIQILRKRLDRLAQRKLLLTAVRNTGVAQLAVQRIRRQLIQRNAQLVGHLDQRVQTRLARAPLDMSQK